MQNERTYIYGAGGFAKRLKKALDVLGIEITSFLVSDEFWKKGDVFSSPLNSICTKENDVVYVGIFNPDVDLRQIYKNLKNAGFKNIIMPWEAVEHLGFDTENYWMNFFLDQTIDNQKVIKIRNLLTDADSVYLYDQIMSFRQTRKLEYLPTPTLNDQYSPGDLILRRNFSTLVDGGAFTGDSINDLLNEGFQFDQIIAFEPNPNNFAILRENLRNYCLRKVILPFALGKEQASFKIGLNGAGSSLSSEFGSQTIQTVALDDIICNYDIDFIKLDVEGFEMDALLGMKEIIKLYRPMIAVSIYHKPNDIYDILEYLNGLVPDRRASIRQHRFNFFDTVLYWNYQ